MQTSSNTHGYTYYSLLDFFFFIWSIDWLNETKNTVPYSHISCGRESWFDLVWFDFVPYFSAINVIKCNYWTWSFCRWIPHSFTSKLQQYPKTAIVMLFLKIDNYERWILKPFIYSSKCQSIPLILGLNIVMQTLPRFNYNKFLLVHIIGIWCQENQTWRCHIKQPFPWPEVICQGIMVYKRMSFWLSLFRIIVLFFRKFWIILQWCDLLSPNSILFRGNKWNCFVGDQLSKC